MEAFLFGQLREFIAHAGNVFGSDTLTLFAMSGVPSSNDGHLTNLNRKIHLWPTATPPGRFNKRYAISAKWDAQAAISRIMVGPRPRSATWLMRAFTRISDRRQRARLIEQAEKIADL
jgi:hypothetical protein